MKFIDKLIRQMSARKKESLFQFYDDDIFLVSYPKSGNTWVRFLLSNIYAKDENINFHNVHKYTPEYESQRNYIRSIPFRPRIIKSHSRFNPLFPKVVYLIRDPRDVYISYYHYLKLKKPGVNNLPDILDLQNLPYGYWHDHVESWLNSGYDGEKILFIKYEDMLVQPEYYLKMILDFGKIPADDKHIKKAVIQSSFENMKESEEKYGRPNQTNDKTVFVRKGKSGNWTLELKDEELERIMKLSGEVMKKFDYT